MSRLDWIDDTRFELEGVRFVASVAERFRSTPDQFLLVKPRPLIERHLELLAHLEPRNIVELGICEGGSTALLALAARPRKLVAVELEAQPVAALEALIAERSLRASVRTYYGLDQSDAARLAAVAAEEFGNEPLDLVVDDASHRLGPTRASFDVLFPRLRPGGVFVIEDWSGLHHWERALEASIRSDPDVGAAIGKRLEEGAEPITPLSVMLFELVLASAFSPELVSDVHVADGWATVVRGAGDIGPEGFALADCYSATAAQLFND